MDRLINYAFLFCLIYLFVMEAGTGERFQIGIAIGAGLLFTFIAFLLKWLTLDGAVAALIFGCIGLGFGGWQAAILIFTFFLTSVLLSGYNTVVIEETSQTYEERERRDGLQVWANGFWFAFFTLLGFLFDSQILYMGAAGAVATATADTWATELGSKRFKGTTWLMKGFEKVAPGTDGGISITGTIGALSGSILMAILTVVCYQDIPLATGLTGILLAGFSGCFFDSYLGSTLQYKRHEAVSRSSEGGKQFRPDNNFVNWAATGLGSLVAVIVNWV